MTEIIGWIGAFLFSICACPQAWQSYKDGHARGLNHSFLWLWFGGESCMIIYVLLEHGLDLPLLTNYVFNFILLFVLIKYKYFERGTEKGMKLIKPLVCLLMLVEN